MSFDVSGKQEMPTMAPRELPRSLVPGAKSSRTQVGQGSTAHPSNEDALTPLNVLTDGG